MDQNLSTFGLVLQWVSKRLYQVETAMSKDPQDDNARNSVSKAHQSIDELLEYDEELRNDFIKAAESEYASLVHLIQSHNPPITDQAAAFAEQLRHEMEKSPKNIKHAEDLLRRMRDSGNHK